MRAHSHTSLVIIVPILSAFVCSGGCSASVYVTLDGSGDSLSYTEFNDEISAEKVQVRTTMSRTMYARNLAVTPDSCTWFDGETGARLRTPLSDMKQVTFVDHLRGFWKGVLFGGLVGAGVGYIVSQVGEWESGRDRELASVLFPAIWGTLGALTGGLAGILTGYETGYVILPYSGGATVLYLHDGTRVIGTVEELVPEKHVVMRTWDGKRVVIDHALIERIEIPKNE